MQAAMTIQVRVYSAQARAEIKALQAQLAGLRASQAGAAASSNAHNASMARGVSGFTKWGNQVQWAGRQLQYNFTLPILLAAGASAKFALENEKAMVRVVKVYGDTSMASGQIKSETDALAKSFEALSNKFGIAQKDAINIAADWAAAGASGVALAKSVELTMETMILGELDAAEATTALIAIQAQYGQSVEQLAKTIDVLNMVENQTGISMQGLVQGFARASGVARSAGVDVEHLAAMMAALVPSAGTAANAGNALKTMLSRLLAPTKEAAEVMAKMGINTKDQAWQSQNGTQRLEKMAVAFQGLDDAQKAVVSSTIASRWQINRFDVLMRDMVSVNGYYQKSLRSTASETDNYKQRVRELNAVLDSNPQKLKQMWTILQNAMADIIQPMIPVIIGVAAAVARMAKSFADMNPYTQKFILMSLLLLAAIGPIARYIGSVAVLVGLLGEAFRASVRHVVGLGRAMIWLAKGPFVLIASGIKALVPLVIGAVGAMAGAVSGIATALYGAMVASFSGVFGAMRVILLATVAQMRGLLIATFTLMGRNLLIIWSTTWTRMMAITAAGAGRVMALMIVFASNMLATIRVLAVGMLASMRGMWVAVLAGMSRMVALIPAMMTGIVTIIRTGMMAVGAAIALVGPAIAVALTSWIFWAVAGAMLLLYGFKDQLLKVWNNIAGDAGGFVDNLTAVFWGLPLGMRNAMLAVVKIVQSAVMKVYELFSYLNPFARHSPSLVEQVTSGMDVIKSQYASVGNVGSAFASAARDLAVYKNAIEGIKGGPFSEDRANVASGIPKMLGLFDRLVKYVKMFNGVLAAQGAAVDRQQAVVDKWGAALKKADAAIDIQSKKLDVLKKNLEDLTSAYDKHKQSLEEYANAPLKGMGAMSDAIFANEQAQNRLRLEMLRWEDVNGSIEDVKNNMSGLAGSIEALRGEAADLRTSGAGSDVLGPINAQIEQMKSAYDAMGQAANASPVNEMQKELEALGKKGQMLDLENSLQFDPLVREIDKLANAQKELSYQTVVDGINRERAAMNALQPGINAATAAVEKQQKVVDSLTVSRDALQATYDAESDKLSALKDAYSKTEDAIRDIESALRDMGSAGSDNIAKLEAAASKAKGLKDAAFKQSPGAQNFDDAAGGNFPDVGGNAQIGREGGMGDQSKLIDEFTKGISEDVKGMFDSIDLFGPLKEKWGEFKKWWTINVERNWIRFSNSIKDAFADFETPAWVGTFTDALRSLWEWAKPLGEMFKKDLLKVFDELGKIGEKVMKELGPEFAKFRDLLPGLTTLLSGLWSGIKILAGVIGALLVGAFKIVSSIIANVLGPAIDLIISIVKNVIKVVRGLVSVLIGIFTGDLGMIVSGVKDIFSGLFFGIVDIVKNLGKIVWGLIKGFAVGIFDWFKWLADVLVGHSIIPDMINDIVDWFKQLPGRAWNAIVTLKDKFVKVATDTWNAFSAKSSELWNSFAKWVSERPKAASDKLSAIRDRLGEVATMAWKWFSDKSVSAWNGITKWISERPQNAYNNLIIIKDKLSSVAKTAWDFFLSKSKEVWNTINTWLGGIPQAAYDKVKGIKDKLSTAAADAFNALKTKASAIVDGKNGFMTWIGELPGRIATAMSSIGTKVSNGIKNSWNTAAGWLNDNGIGAINKVTSKFGFSLDKIPKFAGGGVIPGRVSRKDNTIIAARTGEGVIVPELVKLMGGARGLNAANAAAKSGNSAAFSTPRLDHFENGGIIGKVAGWLKQGSGGALSSIFGAMKQPMRDIIPGKPFLEDWMVGGLQQLQDKAKVWGQQKDAAAMMINGAGGPTLSSPLGAGVLPQRGYQWQKQVVKEKFPWVDFYSDFRPGAITATGMTSYHSMGRAVDMSPSAAIFNWIHDTYGKNSAQLLFSPMNGRQINMGREYNPSAITRADHWDHVHWGYDQGGVLPPGHTLAYNGTGKNEYTMTNGDWSTFSSVVSLLDSMTQKSMAPGAGGGSAMARVGSSLAAVDGRLRAYDARSSQVTSSGGGVTVNIYGDLVMPNVKNGDDADSFIRNLKGLAG